MYYYIYIYLNPEIAGKWSYKDINLDYQPFYVGMGVAGRWKEHLNVSKSRESYETNHTKFKLIKSLKESNSPPIILKLYENISRDEAKLIEKDIIAHFGKLINHTGILTNITDGADDTNCNRLGKDNPHSKSVYQYSLNGEFIKEWDCLREIERALNISYNTIGDTCRGKSKTAHGFQWSYIKYDKIDSIKPNNRIAKYKKVYKFDYNGNLIETYESLINAANNNRLTKNNLSNSILTKSICNGYFFNYENIFDPIKPIKNHFHKIRYNDEFLYLTNSEIMEKFEVSKYYIFEVKRNRIKKPKFIVED